MAKSGGKENLVQSAITDALAVYCREQNLTLQQFPPYANQQGKDMRKFCADIIGMLDDAKLILLEIKEHDCQNNVLTQFDAKQHADNVWFEEAGVPVAYAYNIVAELEYWKKPNRAWEWPEITLNQVNRSLPSALPNQSPAVETHQTLLDWLRTSRSEDVTEQFGRVLGATGVMPGDLRNGVLVLLHGVSEKSLTSLTPTQIEDVMNCLKNNSTLTSAQQNKLHKILGAEAEIFKLWRSPSSAPDSSSDHDSSPSLGF